MLAHFLVTLCLKRLYQNSYQESVRYTSVALCAVGTSVTLHNLRPSVTLCALYVRVLVYHSIFRMNLFFIVMNANSAERNQPKVTFIHIFISSYPSLILLLHMIFALTTGISVNIKVDKTSFNSVPLCGIYPSKAKKYIYKLF